MVLKKNILEKKKKKIKIKRRKSNRGEKGK
jgi:hypothetical protein